MATSTRKTTKPAAKSAGKKLVTGRAAVAKVLADGAPRKTAEITAAAAKIATGLKGKTPEQSLAAFLYTEAKKADGIVERGPDKGTFQLRAATTTTPGQEA